MNERLGIFEERQATAAKYARFITPRGYTRAKPEPKVVDVPARLDAKINRLADLDTQIAAKEQYLRELSALVAKGERVAFKRAPEIIHVQETFCDLLRDAGYIIEDRPYTFNDLVCRANHSPHVEPRHTCMDLVRRLTRATLTDIAKAFCYRDHTSVQHALRRSPVHMASNPMLGDVHAQVLAHFGAQK